MLHYKSCFLQCDWRVNKAQGIDQLSPDLSSHGWGLGTTSHGRPLYRWRGQDSGTSLVSEGGMSNGHPMDVHWTGRTIPSGQKILMANLDMCGT